MRAESLTWHFFKNLAGLNVNGMLGSCEDHCVSIACGIIDLAIETSSFQHRQKKAATCGHKATVGREEIAWFLERKSPSFFINGPVVERRSRCPRTMNMNRHAFAFFRAVDFYVFSFIREILKDFRKQTISPGVQYGFNGGPLEFLCLVFLFDKLFKNIIPGRVWDFLP